MRDTTPGLPALKVDLHPDRPIRRGIAPPPEYKPKVALNPDPTFDEIHARNGAVDLHAEAHEVVGRDGALTGVGVSGEIPRWSRFERGIPGAVTWKEEDGEAGWFTDEVSSHTAPQRVREGEKVLMIAHHGRAIRRRRRQR